MQAALDSMAGGHGHGMEGQTLKFVFPVFRSAIRTERRSSPPNFPTSIISRPRDAITSAVGVA